MSTEKQSFQAEVQQVLDLMIHSVYSNREIFLRELISNASDAIDKRKFEALKNTQLAPENSEYFIRIIPNKDDISLTITDNGIGMNREDVVENIGTIAKSGTKEFFQVTKEMKENPELIGQFGVGFYSAFMVANEVSLHTKKAGEEAVFWHSTGDGTYSISTKEKEEIGTSITLKLKEDIVKEQDFTEEWTIKSIVKKYSDFIAFPIRMKTTKQEPEKDDKGELIEGKFITTVEDEILNSQKALWTRSPSEVKKEEYDEFYRQMSYDWNEPLKVVHFKAEGNLEFNSLMFVPGKRPFNFNTVNAKRGLNLYVKKVFIMSDCEELLPEYLRFVKGVVDCADLSLNISREILQQDQQVAAIKKSLTTKILNTLSDLQKKKSEDYLNFWNSFGSVLKEGIASDQANHEKLSKLFMFYSTKGEALTSLTEYVERMPEEQKHIYFLTGENLSQLRNSPHLEALKEKNYEVLLLNDDIDEWVVNHLSTFSDKQLKSVSQGNLDLETEEEKKKTQEEIKNLSEDYKDILSSMKSALEEEVKEVRISSRLKDSPVCLVSDENDMSANMQRILSAHKGEVPEVKRILEINPKHPVFKKMQSAQKGEHQEWAELFYGQALLNEGSQLKDPVKFSQQINRLILN